ncbi:hypothetical protein JAAARDRAFT_72877 [Jaapia argillacea MUCL 33604]|uniref:C2H2-type domain-containing protein n=1 Tax=Jaapia argillacea MUCL 33604 TaxID=933084 RepID=A0A067PGE1_9AGAM|nr:hypothetical protein JAAARDRAFT_72877 [Jaapia argillacea MUCL 33604]
MIRQIPCGGCGKMYSRNDAIRRHRAGRSCPGRPLAEGEEVGEEDGEEVGEEGEGEVEEDEIKEDE